MNNQPEKTTLSTGKYTIELSNGPSIVYKIDELGTKEWLCSTTDPDTAMSIVEGLILVEHKRFYHPEAKPEIKSSTGAPVPPFLRRG
jgi:hypothetical protein